MKKIIIVLVALCLFVLIFIGARGKVHAKAVVVEQQSTQTRVVIKNQEHNLNVTLNQDFYEIECGDVFDVSNIDIAIDGADADIQFEDETREKSYSQIGEYVEKVIVKDAYDNVAFVEIRINVIDTIGPEIKGVWDCRIIQGGNFRPLYGVVAMDNVDGDVSNTLKCTDFDSEIVGIQTLTITANDKSGNVSSSTFNLTVIEKEPPIFEVPTISNSIFDLIPKKYREVIPYDGLARSVSFWGDSLTQGFLSYGSSSIIVNGISGATESLAFTKLSGIKSYNFGVCGEDSRTIACRQGGLKMYVNGFTIPAKGSITFKSIMCEDGNEVFPLRYVNQATKASFDACSIGGIVGKLSYTNGNYIFTRATEGKELAVTEDTQLISGNSEARKDDILILEMGSNGGWNRNYIDLINQYISMIEYSNCKYYIVVGDTDGAVTDEERVDWDRALEEAFGDHFIRMREYLIANGMRDCGLTPTAGDLGMIEDGEVPDSLKSDWSHLNEYGYYSKGKAIYEKGVKLGYWK